MQALFDEGQNIPVMEGLDIDNAIRMQPGPQQARGEEVAPGQAPENRSLEPCGNAGREQGGGSGKLGSRSCLDDLVQGATSQAMVGKVFVDGWHAEG